ncbi:unnamed protein product [Rotaria sordida]|uniref:Septin-type G domain-containing protein n=1 Tax=Rotaria sordida TaxID=392033 RepID=A0A815N0Z6_9BILA|nr:unnamed protein product [Rotaria sordida]
MMLDSYSIERKAIDISGRLGSFYDASYDKLTEKYILNPSKVEKVEESCSHKILSGDQSIDLLDYLEDFGFNDDLRQSILLGMVNLSGVSSLLNYNRPIDNNTRFLYYSYKSKIEELFVTAGKTDQFNRPSISPHATHMITKILWGIEILCIIQLPNNQSVKTIENSLWSIFNRLQSSDSTFVLSDTEKHQLSALVNIEMYGSQTCIKNSNTTLLTILNKLQEWQKDEYFHHPLLYTMHSLRWLYDNGQYPGTYHLTDQTQSNMARVKSFIFSIDKSIKYINRLLEKIPKNISYPELNQQWKHYKEVFTILTDKYDKYQKYLQQSLCKIRRTSCESVEINNTVSDSCYSSLKTDFKTLCEQIHECFPKTILIEQLINNQIQYVKISDIISHRDANMTIEDINEILKSFFVKTDSSVTLWYSSDQLKQIKPDKWEEFYQSLILEKSQATQETSFFYIDFNQWIDKLEDLYIVRLPIERTPTKSQRDHAENKSSYRILEESLQSTFPLELRRPLASAPSSESKPPFITSSPSLENEHLPITSSAKLETQQSSSRFSTPSESKISSITDINVLLMGETGVGKSTFINAFVNYLMFDSLQQAEQNEPIVLIPVSFLITTGDQFDEFLVKFGDVDSNENHEHQGQSVTQKCKSYIFNLNQKLRLRLIDTPGMGDTRGFVQDKKNIDHILTYINNLSHLNAICLLFKPNDSRLNIFFRSCIDQLLTYLTPYVYNNIIFCFTNSRSTFYAPGNTGSLLRQMLKQEHLKDIPFKKQNTFCFDSESFRYLAARRNDIYFDEFVKQESLNSWTTSVTESVRLLAFILNLKPYDLNEWQSIRKAILEIAMLARPLMETLRLILYNWILYEREQSHNRIILSSNFVTSELCSNCAQSNIVKVGPFYIMEYQSNTNKTTKDCLCPFDEQHFLIEFIVKHEFVSKSTKLSVSDEKNSFYDLLFQCDKLTHFLQQKRLSNENDPFIAILKQFQNEEQKIHDNFNTDANANKRIQDVLDYLKPIREQDSKRLIESNEILSLSEVYKLIDKLKAIPEVKQQIETIKESRRLMMHAHDCSVKIPSMKNKTFSELMNSS